MDDRRSQTSSTLGLLAVLACTAMACGAAATTASDLAVERIERVAKAHADDETFVLRLNPASCDCPPAEVRLDGAWYRTFLEPREPEGPAGLAKTALAEAAVRGDAAATVTVAGKLSKSSRLAGTRAPSLVLKVLRVCPAEGCGAAK